MYNEGVKGGNKAEKNIKYFQKGKNYAVSDLKGLVNQ